MLFRSRLFTIAFLGLLLGANFSSGQSNGMSVPVNVDRGMLQGELVETSPEIINALYGESGLYRGFDPADELVERRTRGTKHFINQDGTVTAIVGAGDLHYQENGQWKEILSHILPNNSEQYTQYQYEIGRAHV